MKKLLLIPMAVLACAYLAAQTTPPSGSGSIQGTVINSLTLQPIPNVQISLSEDKGNGAATPSNLVTILGPNAVALIAADTGQLLPQLNALLSGPQLSTVITDQSGHFAIPNLQAGPYIVTAQMEGYFSPELNGASSPIVQSHAKVANGDAANISILLVPGGTISGRVLDDMGMPAINTTVQVLRVSYPNGSASVQISGSRGTDDRGVYRLYGLMPGSYYVAVSPQTAPGARGGGGRGAAPGADPAAAPAPATAPSALVRTYFPNVSDLSQASPLRLHPGEEISGININFQIAVGAKISGQVISAIPASEMVSPGQVARGGLAGPPSSTVTLYPHDKNALQDPNTNRSVTVPMGEPANGHFEIYNVPPGIYDLYASVPDINGFGPAQPPGRAVQPVAYGRTTVEVRGGDRDGVTITVHHGMDVPGHITIDGALSPSINNVRISLQADDSALRVPVYPQIGRYQPMIDAGGSFTIPSVSEAQYRFQVSFGPPPLPPAANPGTLLMELPEGAVVGIRGGAPAPADAARSETVPAAPLPGPPLGPNAYVADIRQAGMSIYDDGLLVGFQTVAPLEVLVKTNGGIIDGVVMGANQRPAAGATVVLIPAVQHRHNLNLYKIATSDASGHFELSGIRPDEYKLLAWDSIPPGAYMNAEFLKEFEDKEISVNVAAGLTLDIPLTMIPAAH